MGTQIHQLPTTGSIPSDAYMIIKRVVNGQHLDYKVDIGSLFAPYVNRSTEVGTEAGDLFTLIDVNGNPALPAVDGSQLTNLATITATETISGNVRLSDAIDSTNGTTSGRAATPKAVRDLGITKLNLTGGTLTGSLTLNNSVSLLSRLSGGSTVKLIELTGTDVLNIAATGAVSIGTVNLAANTVFNITDGSGTVKFSFNTATGTSTGIKASDTTATATSATSAGSVQNALSELASGKMSATGGTITGNTTLSGTTRLILGTYPFYQDGANTIKLGNSTTKPSYIDLCASTQVRLQNTSGTTIFSFNTSTGVSSGIKAADTSFTASGNITATNVQAAIAELDTEKLGTSATAYDSSRLGGSLASAYLTTATASTTYLGINATAVNANSLGGTAASNFKTLTQNNALYLGINATAYDSSRLGGALASSYLTTASAASTYLGINATAYSSARLGSNLASAYITEAQCDAKYVTAVGATVDNALNLGGVPAASYKLTADANNDYLGKTATATNSNALGGVAANQYLTTSQGNGLYLGITGTATNASSLGGVSASSFSTTAQADAKYLSKTAGNTLQYQQTFNDYVPINIGTGSDVVIQHDGVNTTLSMFNGNFIIDNGATHSFTFNRTNGGFIATGNISANSDIRVKDNFEVIPNALDKVSRLTGFTFDRTDVTTPRQTGLIAQDVLRVLPEAVTEGDNGILSVAYGNLVGLLVEAIKDLKDEVEQLKRKY